MSATNPFSNTPSGAKPSRPPPTNPFGSSSTGGRAPPPKPSFLTKPDLVAPSTHITTSSIESAPVVPASAPVPSHDISTSTTVSTSAALPVSIQISMSSTTASVSPPVTSPTTAGTAPISPSVPPLAKQASTTQGHINPFKIPDIPRVPTKPALSLSNPSSVSSSSEHSPVTGKTDVAAIVPPTSVPPPIPQVPPLAVAGNSPPPLPTKSAHHVDKPLLSSPPPLPTVPPPSFSRETTADDFTASAADFNVAQHDDPFASAAAISTHSDPFGMPSAGLGHDPFAPPVPPIPSTHDEFTLNEEDVFAVPHHPRTSSMPPVPPPLPPVTHYDDDFAVSVTPTVPPPPVPFAPVTRADIFSPPHAPIHASSPPKGNPFAPKLPSVPPPMSPTPAVTSTKGFEDFAVSMSAVDPFSLPATSATNNHSGFDDFAPTVSASNHSDPFGFTPSAISASSAIDNDFNVSIAHDPFAPAAAPLPVQPPPSDPFFPSATSTPTSPPPIPPAIPSMPVEEDDPYEIHVNKPAPNPPVVPVVPVVPVRKENPLVAKAPTKSGDPFENLIAPLKPKVSTTTSTAPPLKSFVTPQQSNTMPISTLPELAKPPVEVDDDPYEIHVVKKTAPAPTPAPVTAPLDHSNDPFFAPSASAPAISNDGFFPSATAGFSDPFAPSAISQADSSSSGFGDAFQVSMTDPFAPSTLPTQNQGFDDFAPSHTAAPVAPSASDFDIFETKKPATSNIKTPVRATAIIDPFAPSTGHANPFASSGTVAQPHPGNEDDDDIFNPKPKVVAPAAASRTPAGGLDIFSPTSKQQRVAAKTAPPASSTGFTDPFAPVPSSSGATVSAPSGGLLDDDPFSIGFDDTNHHRITSGNTGNGGDLLLVDNSQHSHQTEDDDDPFGLGISPVANSKIIVHQEPVIFGDEEDPMKKLRQVYELHSDGDTSHQSDHEIDDDVDNYDSKYFQKKPAPSQPPINTGKLSSSSSSGIAMESSTASDVFDGEIYSRLSTKSLVTKDWHDTYYLIKNNTLYLYKSKIEYQKNPKGYKKKIPITHNLRVLQIKSKDYKGLGPVYNFMLEEVLDYGPSNVGKFGSTYRPVIEELWKRLRHIILKRREERAQANQRYG